MYLHRPRPAAEHSTWRERERESTLQKTCPGWYATRKTPAKHQA